jgi:DNA-binding Lrp family transcriptional regulator
MLLKMFRKSLLNNCMAKVFKSVTHIIEMAEPFMDKTDLVLCQLLLANSRLSYRDLADTLDLSVTAVHNRIQNLVESGIIRKFTAKLGLLASNTIHVFIFGSSRINPGRELNSKLQQHGSIYWLAIGGGNFLYVGAYLRNISELEPLVSYIKKEAGMTEPTVGLTYSVPPFPAFPSAGDNKLYALDYQIIRSLKDNSRKATSDIAEELGVSAKTARRRLSRMMKNGLIELSIEWYPDASNDIFTVFHVQTKPETDKNAVDKLFKKYSPNVIFYWGFGNIPNTFVALVWTSTMKELQSIRESLEHEADVQSTVPNILYTGYIFNCWRDQIPEK